MATQNMYEGAVNNFESLITVPVTVAGTTVTGTATNSLYAGCKIMSVMQTNQGTAGFVIADSITAYSPTATDAYKNIISPLGDIAVDVMTANAADRIFLVTILVPKNI